MWLFEGSASSTCLCFGCRWSQTFGEGGHYSVWIHESEAANCSHTVERDPNNILVRE